MKNTKKKLTEAEQSNPTKTSGATWKPKRFSSQTYADFLTPNSSMKTQEQLVISQLQEPKSIKEVSQETWILEPNIRRILWEGAKTWKFNRVAPWVYVLNTGSGTKSIIKTADALEELPKLIAEWFKTDMVFLDIPYKTKAVMWWNRGIKYETISPEQLREFLLSLAQIVRDDKTPVYFMFSNAPSGMKQMQRYLDMLQATWFSQVALGNWNKIDKSGKPRKNMLWNVMPPEGIGLYSLSGEVTEYEQRNLEFTMRNTQTASEKPEELIWSLIQQSTQIGDMVCDFFAWAWVVSDMCLRLGRSCFATEKDENRVQNEILPRMMKYEF